MTTKEMQNFVARAQAELDQLRASLSDTPMVANDAIVADCQSLAIHGATAAEKLIGMLAYCEILQRRIDFVTLTEKENPHGQQ